MIRPCLLLAALSISRAQGDECPYRYDYTQSVDGGCFKLVSLEESLNFTEAQKYCENNIGSLVTILSNEELYFITDQAIALGWGDDPYWLGLSCKNGLLKWTEHCWYSYNNFYNYDDTTCPEGDENAHFIGSANDKYWRKAPDGMVTNKIVCSISSIWNGCLPSDPDNLGRMFATEGIILGVTALTVFVLTCAVCGCVCMLGRRYRKKKAKEEEEKQWRQAQLEAAQLSIQTNGEAVTPKALERTASMRYTPFPRAEGAGKEFDEWEIDRRHVSIDYTTKLGQGAFGSVYLGIVDNSNIPTTTGKSIIEQSALKKDNNAVAIKMLHESADKMQQMQFFEEIDLMKRLGYHERLVNMLACATQSEPALLIIEYCAHGDLLNYMRERRQIMLGSPEAISSIDRSKIITQKQQLMFCVQIAYGMEYLSQRGFVHRDIAARNILVDQHESCKIGDFGLCREVEKEDEHYHSRGGRLPLKWMSPEAIEKYDFTIASDVWSFGVLLFEIITLGGNPYPDWPSAEILNRLKRGRRMERPDNCTDHMFTVSEEDYYLRLNAQAMYYTDQSIFEQDVDIDDEETDETLRSMNAAAHR
uniref:C-type lectin n=1 Tax=Pristionchus pacificus TaxID=54126 RepID=A0A2A6BT77_PRIPA|eukprot:PDM69104.1 C-type lectin [Pristionchus pacificus]